ncbi:MAG: hypothetical protein M3Z03_10225, partial [Actinomycetota bacterium]|nr:hypothetical protein [Actinomycetota bacterium]
MSVPSSGSERGYFRIGQRLFRGYGPLAVFALMILLLSVLVPSKVEDKETVSSAGGNVGLSPSGPSGEGDVATDG